MVSALEADDGLSAGSLTRELDCRLDGLGARVPEEEAVEGRVGHDGEETLDELEVGSGEHDGALHVDEVRDLLGRRGGDDGVAAARVSEASGALERRAECIGQTRTRPELDSLSEVGDSDTGSEVEETLSVGGDEFHAFALDDDMVPQPAETAADVLAAKVGPLGGSPHWGGHVGVGGVLLERWLGSAVGSRDERASAAKR